MCHCLLHDTCAHHHAVHFIKSKIQNPNFDTGTVCRCQCADLPLVKYSVKSHVWDNLRSASANAC